MRKTGLAKPKQLALLKNVNSAYGGDLRKTRIGRGARPLATRQTMHLVLRSSKATGEWSFRHPRNRRRVKTIITKFANKNGVRILSMANVGNHLHLHIKLSTQFAYGSFIRAITGAIAQAVTGRTRWKHWKHGSGRINHSRARQGFSNHTNPTDHIGPCRVQNSLKFWDYRPFSRIVESWKAVLNLRDYMRLNEIEGGGASRRDARAWIEIEKDLIELRV